MYLIFRTIFNIIIYALIMSAYGVISWQYLLGFLAVIGLMIVCYDEGRNE